MTLCLAWKNGNKIYYCSDSRLTKKDQSTLTDNATKIFKVGVEIYSPTPADDPNEKKQLLKTNFGICFTGSYLNGSLIADSIEEVLSNIQVTPYSDYTIENLSDIALTIYKEISIQLMELNREDGLSEMLFGGNCPVNDNFKLFQFTPKAPENREKIEFTKNEVNLMSTVLIGDSNAKDKATFLLEKISPHYSHFHLIREIINDSEVPTVGGYIQTGVFSKSNFKTYGIVEYEIDEDEHGNKRVVDKYQFRNLTLDIDNSELRKGNINIMKPFINPFKNERDELLPIEQPSPPLNSDRV